LPFGWILWEIVEDKPANKKSGLTLESLAKELGVTTNRLKEFADEENIALFDAQGKIESEAAEIIREYRKYL
jgi:hypothetical protein